MRCALRWGIFCLLIGMVSPACFAVRYSITPIGPVGVESTASGINNQGQVVGTFYTDPFSPTGFQWEQGGGFRTFGTLSGYDYSVALSINNVGQVFGASQFIAATNPIYDIRTRPVVYQTDGTISDVGIVEGNEFLPIAINDQGTLLGSAPNSYVTWNPRSGLTTHTIANSMYVQPKLINNNGDVIVRAIIYKEDSCGMALILTTANGAAQQIAFITGNEWLPTINALNDSGMAVGASWTGSVYNSFIWTPENGSQLLFTDGINSRASAVNNIGQVVGQGMDCETYQSFAYLYENGDVTYFDAMLDDSKIGWEDLNPLDINDRGQIVGSGYFQGQQQAFIMTPLSGTIPVPEPASLSLIVLGSALMLRRRA